VAIDERAFGVESTEVADDLEGLAEIERELGHVAEAERVLARMQKIREKTPPSPAGG
jgi:hypothetical protein